MAQSDSDLEASLEDDILDSASGVAEWQVGNRRVRREKGAIKSQLDALLTLRGLQSSKRGYNLGQIDRAE